ncbi:diphthine methyltransferase [Drosophila pseudoobscura]|uniref:methylated diphthine methylhydrolase n=1 Tax=Drosophila pseudoobscura pseudoobscura TaxID=46245 RepID=A0A6I8UGT0_DROPS|nr:diphthine methyltransferase [Drosophila pseudoobscura]
MARFRTLHSVDTNYSADSVEWCAQDGHHAYFACGTYQLVEAEENEVTTKNRPRKGRVYLYHFDTGSGALERVQSIETAAVLDMKWLPAWSIDSGPLLATANALGEVEIYELLSDEKQLQRRMCLGLTAAEPTAEAPLALALDWQRDGDELQLVVSDSKGNINLLRYTPQGKLFVLSAWNAHSFEAWTCVFDRWTPHRVYSGGDDCLLQARDLRTEQLVWTNRAHQAGVTCLLSHPKHDYQLLTGSYDEQLRVFDTRMMKRSLAEVNLGGGIWRLKPHPNRAEIILAACMYNNFSVVQLDLENSAVTMLGTYDEHSSICYGADWNPSLSEGDGLMHMATCSFYDHKMCVSSFDLGCSQTE